MLIEYLHIVFCVIMRPVPVSQATASPIHMKFAVKVSQHLFIGISSVKPALGLLEKRHFFVVNSTISGGAGSKL